MKKQFLLGMILSSVSILIFTHSVNADGGRRVGNGGGACVCRGNYQNIVKAELLDLVEAEDSGLKIIRNNEDIPDAQVQRILSKISSAEYEYNKILEELKILPKITQSLDGNSELTEIHDSIKTVCKKKYRNLKCNVEQVANYTDDGKLYIDNEIYEAFSNTDKAALKVHEAIYALDRKTNDATTSDFTKLIVGQLFAEGQNFDIDLISGKFVDNHLLFMSKELFFQAVMDGNIKTVRAMLDKGFYIETRGNYGIFDVKYEITPLMAAVYVGNSEMVKFLLSSGASPNVRSSMMYALDIAALNGNIEMLKLLSANGAKYFSEYETRKFSIEVIDYFISTGTSPLEFSRNELFVKKLIKTNQFDLVKKIYETDAYLLQFEEITDDLIKYLIKNENMIQVYGIDIRLGFENFVKIIEKFKAFGASKELIKKLNYKAVSVYGFEFTSENLKKLHFSYPEYLEVISTLDPTMTKLNFNKLFYDKDFLQYLLKNNITIKTTINIGIRTLQDITDHSVGEMSEFICTLKTIFANVVTDAKDLSSLYLYPNYYAENEGQYNAQDFALAIALGADVYSKVKNPRWDNYYSIPKELVKEIKKLDNEIRENKAMLESCKIRSAKKYNSITF